jgi:uncharacterized integral membrane protein
MAIIALVSLQPDKRNRREYMRLSFHTFCGFAICLICLINTNKPSQKNYMKGAWMLPTICIIFFACVVMKQVMGGT